MPKKLGRGKKIYVGQIDIHYTYPDEIQWRLLAKKLQIPLTDNLRKQLLIATMMFAVAGPASAKSASANLISNEIGLWIKRTKILCKRVWQADMEQVKLHRRPLAEEGVGHILERHFGSKLQKRPVWQMRSLAETLDGAMAVANYIKAYIDNPKRPGHHGAKLWIVWVAFLISLMRKEGILVFERAGSKKKVLSTFIAFISEIQKTLPPQCQRRKTDASIRKGIISALHIVRRSNTSELMELLACWGLGISDFGYSIFGERKSISKAKMQNVVERFEKQVNRQKSKKRPERKAS